MIEALLVIAIVTLICCIIALFIISNYNSIVAIIYKINTSDQKINETLKSKEDFLNRAINIIERQLKIESKMFDDFKKINSSKLTNIDKDVLLHTTFAEVKKISEDYPELSEVKSYNGLLKDIKDSDIHLGGMKNMYNKYVAIYNKDITKFPKNIIAKFRNFKIKNLYEIPNKKEVEFKLID